jgi:hypothetical protein
VIVDDGISPVMITNGSAHEIVGDWIMAGDSSDWGTDLLGSDETIEPGNSRSFEVEDGVKFFLQIGVARSCRPIRSSIGLSRTQRMNRMTHKTKSNIIEELLKVLSLREPSGPRNTLQVLLNTAMKTEQ